MSKPEPDQLGAWVNGPPRRRRTRSQQDWRERVAKEAGAMRASGDWSGCRPEHLVALYAWCHEHVYGVQAAELLDRVQMLGAVARCKAFCAEQFGRGEATPEACARAVDFVRWTWGREAAREKRARESGQDGRRLGWRLQFSASLVTDYRLSLARRGEALP